MPQLRQHSLTVVLLAVLLAVLVLLAVVSMVVLSMMTFSRAASLKKVVASK